MAGPPGDTRDWLDASQGSNDIIQFLGPLTLPVSVDIATPWAYRSLIVNASAVDVSGLYSFYFTALDANEVNVQVTTVVRSMHVGSGSVNFTVPVPCISGGHLQYAVIGPAGATSVGMGMVASTGLEVVQSQLVRSDGRPYPVGQNAAHDESTASATLIAAPGAGRRIMLMSLYTTLPSAVINGEIIVQGAIGGTGIDLLVTAINANANGMMAVAPIPPQGWLLDENTPVTVLNFSTASQRTNVVYDLVG